ncbi:MAG: hypothetical protein CR996_00395 [Draconibacterium sp.]|nr:MAG: hypothetical protein CR996_00395 [Draconibacterium sp.]PIF06495.1 MAG: hypothetical protein CSA36_01570 [Draconibacterium sp.]
MNVIELGRGDERIILAPEYQGRVMTSTLAGDEGVSFGWINHDLIASGEKQAHINAIGGEERFWLGPEGGQFSIFFPAGSSFEFDNWQTPEAIDTRVYDVDSQSEKEAVFSTSIELKNYSNFTFNFDVKRKVVLLDKSEIVGLLGIEVPATIKSVGFSTSNRLTNTGEKAWSKDTGLLSVWLLGMFNPSDKVTVIVPYQTKAESDYIVKDDYFGKVPDDRLVLKEGIVYFRGDGKQRGKIGIPPQRALPVIGSYDDVNQVLTVVRRQEVPATEDYVNSAWRLQEFPYKGDAINSYNDGPLEDGTQIGPFYELETSSPALALHPGASAKYTQATIHFQGEKEELNSVCQQLFDISLDEVTAVFK